MSAILPNYMLYYVLYCPLIGFLFFRSDRTVHSWRGVFIIQGAYKETSGILSFTVQCHLLFSSSNLNHLFPSISGQIDEQINPE